MKKKIKVALAVSILICIFIPTIAFASDVVLPSEASDEEIHEEYEAAKENLDNIYYNTLNRLSEDGGPLDEGNTGEWLYKGFVRFYDRFAAVSWYIAAVSFFLGILVIFIARTNKRMQRWAILFLVILIPLACLVIRYGLGASPLFKRI